MKASEEEKERSQLKLSLRRSLKAKAAEENEIWPAESLMAAKLKLLAWLAKKLRENLVKAAKAQKARRSGESI